MRVEYKEIESVFSLSIEKLNQLGIEGWIFLKESVIKHQRVTFYDLDEFDPSDNSYTTVKTLFYRQVEPKRIGGPQ